MNEIVGPIYYVFATDSRKEWKGKLQISLSTYNVGRQAHYLGIANSISFT